MNEELRNQIREQILEEINEVRRDVAKRESEQGAIAPDKAIGRVSRMDAIGNKAVSDFALNAARERLSQLENALEAVDSPNFGLCEICGQRIPAVRLQAIPEATMCVTCAGG